MLDGVTPTRAAIDDRELSGLKILIIHKDGSRVQAVDFGQFNYRYKRPLDSVVDDPATPQCQRVPLQRDRPRWPYQRRHPCGSRFTKQARVEYWPTLYGRMANRLDDLSAFTVAVPNTKEVERALDDTGLRARLTTVLSQLEVMALPKPYVMPDALMVESHATGQGYVMTDAWFLVEGAPVPADAKLIVQGDRMLLGNITTLPLADVRRARVTDRPGQCPLVEALLKSGEAWRINRCNGPALSAEVNGQVFAVDQIQARALQVREGKVVADPPAELKTMHFAVGMPATVVQRVPFVMSLGVLTPDEVTRMKSR